jgi:hypothetical protein
MTTPTTLLGVQQQLLEGTINPSVTNAQAAVNTAPPGAVQSDIDFTALGTALDDYVQVAADVGNVFAQTFMATITENLLIASLVTSIIGDIEAAVAIGVGFIPRTAVVAAAAAPAATVTASSVLAQVQQQATANLASVNTVFQDARSEPGSNFPAGLEAQVLGGQILFQQDINAVLSSLPASLSPANDSNAGLISTLQNLLLVEQNLSTILTQIDTYDHLEQPISLTGLNVAVILADTAILTDVSLAAFTYAAFAYQALSKQLVTVSAPGAYTVNVPSGAKYVDLVLIGGGAGGGGYDTPGSGTGGNGGNTTATPAGGSTLTAAGGLGGASSTGSTASAGAPAGSETFDGYTYGGGPGGAAGYNSAGGNGTAPGGGGGGGGAFGNYGGAGGAAGVWAAETIAIPSGTTTITGSVGAGGTGGATSIAEPGGTGGNGEAFFRFYS